MGRILAERGGMSHTSAKGTYSSISAWRDTMLLSVTAQACSPMRTLLMSCLVALRSLSCTTPPHLQPVLLRACPSSAFSRYISH